MEENGPVKTEKHAAKMYLENKIVQLPQDVVLENSYVQMTKMTLIQLDLVMTMRMKQKMHQDMTAQHVN